MEVVLDNKIIKIEIIYKNNKNIYMRFKDSNTLVVTCSRFVSKSYILNIIKNDELKLVSMLKRMEEQDLKDRYFYYLGKKYIIVYDNISKNPYFDGEFIYAKDEKVLNKYYKNEVKRVFTSEVDRIKVYFEDIPSFSLKFRKMKTRWGVNNRGNNTITLNEDLLKRDIDLLDYVIIHELCHFYEANHSERFWRHVEEYYPKYKEARKRLREV